MVTSSFSRWALVSIFVVSDSVLGKVGIVGHVHGVTSNSGQMLVGHGPGLVFIFKVNY